MYMYPFQLLQVLKGGLGGSGGGGGSLAGGLGGLLGVGVHEDAQDLHKGLWCEE